MLRLSLIILLFAGTAFGQERPTCNLPIECREANYLGPNGQGSCCHATMTMAFRWMLEDDIATYWRSHYADGDYASDEWNYGSNLARKFDDNHIPYVYTTDPDVSFLEWAIATRRGCGITVMSGKHMCFLVDLTPTEAAIIDPNQIDRIIWVDRQRLEAEWLASNHWAVTPCLSPSPPLPR